MATSILGFTCSEEQAREIDRLLAEQPAGDEYAYRKSVVGAVDRVEQKERADVSVVTSAAVDRDGEIVEPAGLDLEQFRRNPVVMCNHRYQSLPVGRAAWIKHDDRAKTVVAKTVYADKPAGWSGDWEADAVWALVSAGVLSGKSIGFLPREMREPTPAEREAGAKRVYTKSTLLEYSVASIPSNPEALVASVSKGIVNRKTLEALGVPLTLDPARYQGRPVTPTVYTATQLDARIRAAVAGRLDAVDWTAVAAQAEQRAAGRV